ncbi:hypothetical protein NQ314_009818 [Rhamnusium bicolor]|uniref:Uncharacterized protein n=1 Tax=Rhamnusium bicolor TaxID=1586634 RepID=A0AAV8XWA4_9CUCU|nr:hypothetical protein NQ314_009818 [Rhamnusium bicolor]
MYNLRSQSNTDDTSSSENPPIVTMANPILMTEEQLQSLLSGMIRALATTQNVQTATGNFANCASHFAGNNDEDVEAFISAISIYKDCVNITGENEIKGLPMLLDHNAATWWQGVKSTISTWDDAVKALRHSFGYNKPPHKIFKELFSRDQGDKEPTDFFVNSARALLACLPETPVLHLTDQLDMVYGLLNRRIRHRLPREQVTSFSELVEKSRSIEDSFAENVTSTVPKHNSANDDKTNFAGILAIFRQIAANMLLIKKDLASQMSIRSLLLLLLLNVSDVVQQVMYVLSVLTAVHSILLLAQNLQLPMLLALLRHTHIMYRYSFS